MRKEDLEDHILAYFSDIQNEVICIAGSLLAAALFLGGIICLIF